MTSSVPHVLGIPVSVDVTLPIISQSRGVWPWKKIVVGTEFEKSPDDEKLKLVQEACKSAYAHEFIEELPEVSIFN